MHPKKADGLANSVDPDQTVPFRSSLIWVCTFCSDLSVPILRIFKVLTITVNENCFIPIKGEVDCRFSE